MNLSAARVAWAARVFTLAALGSLSAAFTLHDPQTWVLVELLALGLLMPLGDLARLPAWVAPPVEAAAVMALVAVGLPVTATVGLYVSIPVFVAGVAAGVRCFAASTAAQVAVVAVLTMTGGVPLVASTAQLWVTCLFMGVGLGLLGSYVHQLEVHSDAVDRDYRTARDLLRRLRELSGQLTTGLDPAEIADIVLVRTRSLFVEGSSAVLTVAPGSEAVRPVRYSSEDAVALLVGSEPVVREAWRTSHLVTSTPSGTTDPGVQGSWTALPLLVDDEVVAVVVGTTAPEADRDGLDTTELEGLALRLDTGLAFADLRSAATLEERQRLAREVHDGVAQDVASLGYLIDELQAGATGETARGLADLRAAVRDVVTELRYSIFDLRHELHSEEGLGTALAGVARQVGSRSDMRVHLTLDEQSVRMRPDVENELLRIGQEAMNNARRHSGARNLWVSCSVHPPVAEVVVRDDGTWSPRARSDSHGLRIMSERAQRIGGELEIGPSEDGRGTMVRVTVGLATPSPHERDHTTAGAS